MAMSSMAQVPPSINHRLSRAFRSDEVLGLVGET